MVNSVTVNSLLLERSGGKNQANKITERTVCKQYFYIPHHSMGYM